MSSTCFEPEDSSSGRQLYIQLWYSVFYMHWYKQSSRWKGIEHTVLPARVLILMHVKHIIPYYTCIYNRLPEDEPLGSKHVEDIKIKKLHYQFGKSAFFGLILYEKLRSIDCTFLRMSGSYMVLPCIKCGQFYEQSVMISSSHKLEYQWLHWHLLIAVNDNL